MLESKGLPHIQKVHPKPWYHHLDECAMSTISCHRFISQLAKSHEMTRVRHSGVIQAAKGEAGVDLSWRLGFMCRNI